MTLMHALSIDVEDWFHILDLENGYSLEQWPTLESRVADNTRHLLRILKRHNTQATFFILGWVAEHYPRVVEEIHAAGHEVASHGYSHCLCNQMSPEAFRADVRRSVDLLEGITGEPVRGYRVPGYSITPENLWALDTLIDMGFEYDSSIYPGSHGHGGVSGARRFPYYQQTPRGRRIHEFPASCFTIFGKNIAFAGGGYLRLLPYPAIKRGFHVYQRAGQPVMVYLHPREIDPGHPRMPMPLYRRFKSYVNLRTTERKLTALLKDFRFGRIIDIVQEKQVNSEDVNGSNRSLSIASG